MTGLDMRSTVRAVIVDRPFFSEAPQTRRARLACAARVLAAIKLTTIWPFSRHCETSHAATVLPHTLEDMLPALRVG